MIWTLKAAGAIVCDDVPPGAVAGGSFGKGNQQF